MRNADIKYKVESALQLLEEWMELVEAETDPAEDFKTDGVFGAESSDDMLYPYQAGVWKARAGMNADKLKRLHGWLLNEFREIGVQSRKKVVE